MGFRHDGGSDHGRPGPAAEADLCADRDTGLGRGYAFVDFYRSKNIMDLTI